jgi:hypothetical protein
MCILFWAAVAAVAIVIFAVLLPKALARPIQRLIALMMAKLTRQQLIALIVGACALLPCTLILPMQPFIWIAGECVVCGMCGLPCITSSTGLAHSSCMHNSQQQRDWHTLGRPQVHG